MSKITSFVWCACYISIIFSLLPALVLAQSNQQLAGIAEVQTAYEFVASVTPTSITTPTVVAVPLSDEVQEANQFVVYDAAQKQFLPAYVDTEKIMRPVIAGVSTLPVMQRAALLADNDVESFVEFTVDGQSAETAIITIRTIEPVTTSAFKIDLTPYVALPLTIGVRAGYSGENVMTNTIVPRRMTSGYVQFPEVTADTFEITMTHIQPLRISEVEILTSSEGRLSETRALRFLAQPGQSYQIFGQPDRPVRVLLGESGDLVDDTDVVTVPAPVFTKNALYTPADVDGDGVRDLLDNCVQVANTDQVDLNDNGRGDVCDDFDRDGVSNATDNCVNEPNRRQADEDGDGIGDVCDEEESRFTEANPWVPWVGIGAAALVLLVLFTLIAIKPQDSLEEEIAEE